VDANVGEKSVLQILSISTVVCRLLSFFLLYREQLVPSIYQFIFNTVLWSQELQCNSPLCPIYVNCSMCGGSTDVITS
jgi:hypothetical protein